MHRACGGVTADNTGDAGALDRVDRVALVRAVQYGGNSGIAVSHADRRKGGKLGLDFADQGLDVLDGSFIRASDLEFGIGCFQGGDNRSGIAWANGVELINNALQTLGAGSVGVRAGTTAGKLVACLGHVSSHGSGCGFGLIHRSGRRGQNLIVERDLDG